MAKNEKKQEEQAAAEERDEVLELENQSDGPDVSSLPTPGGTKISGDKTNFEEPADDDAEPTKGTAKAGKRSAKAVRESEAETERKEAATAKKDEPARAKVVHQPNPKNRHGKNYLDSLKLIDRVQHNELEDAIDLAKKTSKVKFDASVELHANLGVDPRQADQMVRDTVVLPAGTGKKLRIAVLASADKVADAKKAGADIASDGDLINQIEKGQVDFDVLIATPDMMSQLSKVAKVLGPKGLMPNPKSGTVTANVATAVEQAKAGKVEFRIDKQAIVHMAIGKVSFTNEQLLENARTAIDAIMKAKPAAAKGTYMQSLSLTTSMGPGIKLDVQKAISAAHAKK